MKPLESHHLYKSSPDIMAFSEKLLKDTQYIHFCSYNRPYDNGKVAVLSSREDWSRNTYEKYFDSSSCLPRINQGWNYWKRNENKTISYLSEDARDNFDIAARIEFVARDEVNKCYHLFSFYSDRDHEDRAYRFYDTYRGKLLKFISYFQREASKLIKKANQPNNLITIPGYSTDAIVNPMRDYDAELKRENIETEMSSRAFEIMCMYCNGYSAHQIADMLNKSLKTIEGFISVELYKKHGFKNRADMRKYIIDNGYDNLDVFF